MMTNEELEEIRESYWGRPGSNQERKIRSLLAHVDEQASQIAALKAALLKDRFWLIWKGGECASVERATAKAEHQLAQEYPEIAWGKKNEKT